MARCVIVSAGDVSEAEKELVLPGDFLIACDGGYLHCARLGLVPDIILGDFDSAPRPGEGTAKKTVVLPHVKDDTDTHHAARLAAEKGFGCVLLLGALGGRRMEHTLANLATGLWLARQGIETTLAGAYSRVSYVLPGRPGIYEKSERYAYLSVFPLNGTAEGVDISGTFYPLENAVLEPAFPLGVSNEITASEARVSVKTGALVVIETRAD